MKFTDVALAAIAVLAAAVVVSLLAGEKIISAFRPKPTPKPAAPTPPRSAPSTTTQPEDYSKPGAASQLSGTTIKSVNALIQSGGSLPPPPPGQQYVTSPSGEVSLQPLPSVPVPAGAVAVEQTTSGTLYRTTNPNIEVIPNAGITIVHLPDGQQWSFSGSVADAINKARSNADSVRPSYGTFTEADVAAAIDADANGASKVHTSLGTFNPNFVMRSGAGVQVLIGGDQTEYDFWQAVVARLGG